MYIIKLLGREEKRGCTIHSGKYMVAQISTENILIPAFVLYYIAAPKKIAFWSVKYEYLTAYTVLYYTIIVSFRIVCGHVVQNRRKNQSGCPFEKKNYVLPHHKLYIFYTQLKENALSTVCVSSLFRFMSSVDKPFELRTR